MSDFARFINEHAERIKRFRESLTPETDRGCAVIAAAFVDEELKRLIIARLADEPKLIDEAFSGNGPLSSFSARIDFAFLLGMLPRGAWRDLHMVRKTRNEFAHCPDPLSFTDESIRSRCSEFTYTPLEREAAPRLQFMSVVCGLLAQIHTHLFKAEHSQIPKDLTEIQMAKVRANTQEMAKRLRETGNIVEEIIRASNRNDNST